MKRLFFVMIICFGVVLTGCEKEKPTVEPDPIEEPDNDERYPLWEEADGCIWINDNPDVTIDSKDEYLEERETLFY